MKEWGEWLAWVLVFLLGVGLVIAGLVLLFRRNVLDKQHPTEITWGDRKFSTTNVGIWATGVGVVLAAGMYLLRPDAGAKTPAEQAALPLTAQTVVTVTQPLRARDPSETRPDATTSTISLPSTSPHLDGSCASLSGPWYAESKGLQIIVTDIGNPASKKLQFTLRVENNTSDSVNIDPANILAVDSNGKQYEISHEGLGILGLLAASGQVVPAKIDLATPLQGAPTSVELRFNLSQGIARYRTLSVCVPVPSR